MGDFLFLGAHPALDFVNTRTVDRGRAVERLGDFDALVSWARAARLETSLDAETAYARWATHPEAPRVHREAIALREATRAWLADDRAFAPLLARLNVEVTRIEPRPQVARDGGRFVWQTWLDDADPAILLRALALPIVDLLCAVPPADVRRCEADDCEVWFRAHGRTSGRTWCSEARCGMRSRMARSRRRRPW